MSLRTARNGHPESGLGAGCVSCKRTLGEIGISLLRHRSLLEPRLLYVYGMAGSVAERGEAMGGTGRQKLAAILVADAAGYSRLMSQDEAGALAALDEARAVFRSEIALHAGRVIDMAGDSVLAVFGTAAGAVNAALATQRQLEDLAIGVPADGRLRFRIGLHIGDVIEKDDGTVYGDGVNIASRIEGLAPPGGIAVSDAIQAAVRQHVAAHFEDLGAQQVKNIPNPVRVYCVFEPGHRATWSGSLRSLWRRKRLRWATVFAGILFAASVGSYRAFLSRQEPADPAAALPRFSLAVLPVRSSVGPDGAEYAESFTSDLTSGLARSLSLFYGGSVAAHEAVVREQARGTDLRALGKALNVRFLLNGDVGRQGQSIVVNLSLVDVVTATQAWGLRIDTPIELASASADLPILRACQAARVAIRDIEIPRIARARQQDRSALDHALLGLYFYGDTDQAQSAARASCDEALKLDPELPAALDCRATTLVEEAESNVVPSYAEHVREADELTRRAMRNAPINDSRAWYTRAQALAMQHQWSAVFEANANAIRFEPSRTAYLDAQIYWLVLAGRAEEALPLIERALDINIPGASAETLGEATGAYLALGRFKNAADSGERAIGEAEFWRIHVYLAIAYAQLGDLERAALARRRTLQLRPEFTIGWYRRLTKQQTESRKYWQEWERNFYPGLVRAGFSEN